MHARFGMLMLVAAAALSPAAQADTIVQMTLVNESGKGKSVGQMDLSDTPYGLVITPLLNGLPPGLHGFHVHENASCDAGLQDAKVVAGQAAGGRYDPKITNKHGLPWGDGHLGDLPALYVDAGGRAIYPVLAPRLKAAAPAGAGRQARNGSVKYTGLIMPIGILLALETGLPKQIL